jgi:hypothetical protein
VGEYTGPCDGRDTAASGSRNLIGKEFPTNVL